MIIRIFAARELAKPLNDAQMCGSFLFVHIWIWRILYILQNGLVIPPLQQNTITTKKELLFKSNSFLSWCHQESNRGHKDFQSFALPTELWHQLCFV